MKNCVLVFSIFLLTSEVAKTFATDWSYDEESGPCRWGNKYPSCKGANQSPINIPPLCGLKYDESLTKFYFHGFDVSYENATIKNNGHTVQVDINDHMTVEGGGLEVPFKVEQFHFHWGTDNSNGSEHTLDGKYFPLELHIVTYNMKYEDLATAVDKPNGLAVLGFWYEIQEPANNNFKPLLEKISRVRYRDQLSTISDLKIESLLPTSRDLYYRYRGSLTTPPCYESVTWTMFDDRIKLSADQMDIFRSLFQDKDGGHPMTSNYRPVQKINTRKIYVNQKYSKRYETEEEVCEIKKP